MTGQVTDPVTTKIMAKRKNNNFFKGQELWCYSYRPLLCWHDLLCFRLVVLHIFPFSFFILACQAGCALQCLVGRNRLVGGWIYLRLFKLSSL